MTIDPQRAQALFLAALEFSDLVARQNYPNGNNLRAILEPTDELRTY